MHKYILDQWPGREKGVTLQQIIVDYCRIGFVYVVGTQALIKNPSSLLRLPCAHASTATFVSLFLVFTR